MIVYYAMTKFHLLFSMTHKLRCHKEEKADLFLYSGIQDLALIRERLEKAEIFREIYVVPEIELRKDWKPLNEKSPEEEILENADLLTKAVDAWLPISLRRAEAVYLANDHWALGTYCICKKIPYIYYEDGVGMLSRPEYSLALVRKLNTTHAIVASYLGAFGENPWAVKKLADLTEQKEGFADERAEHFSLKEQLADLSEQERNQFLFIFDAVRYEHAENGTLLLTEHFVNMKRLSIEGQRELYGMLVDFFGRGKLYIKPHPNDFHIDYGELFPDAEKIQGRFPSELLPYCFDGKPELGLAACSTSVLGLKGAVKRILRFDTDIENHYQKMFRYFLLKEIGQLAAEAGIRHLISVNARKDLLDGFQIPWETLQKQQKDALFLLEDAWEEEKIRKESAVFLEEMALWSMENPLPTEGLVLLRIRKRAVKEKTFSDPGEEYLWVYTVNKDLKEKLKTMEVKKIMNYTGLQFEAEAMTDDKDLQIQMLKGNLAASLARLKKYQEEEKEHLQVIRELREKLKNRDQEILKSVESILRNQKKGEEQ